MPGGTKFAVDADARVLAQFRRPFHSLRSDHGSSVSSKGLTSGSAAAQGDIPPSVFWCGRGLRPLEVVLRLDAPYRSPAHASAEFEHPLAAGARLAPTPSVLGRVRDARRRAAAIDADVRSILDHQSGVRRASPRRRRSMLVLPNGRRVLLATVGSKLTFDGNERGRGLPVRVPTCCRLRPMRRCGRRSPDC